LADDEEEDDDDDDEDDDAAVDVSIRLRFLEIIRGGDGGPPSGELRMALTSIGGASCRRLERRDWSERCAIDDVDTQNHKNTHYN
jgi:hypothetical protein